MSAVWLLAAYIALCSFTCFSQNTGSVTPRVRIESGEILGGIDHTTITGRRLYSFLGVPYASPPVFKNRFKVTYFYFITSHTHILQFNMFMFNCSRKYLIRAEFLLVYFNIPTEDGNIFSKIHIYQGRIQGGWH